MLFAVAFADIPIIAFGAGDYGTVIQVSLNVYSGINIYFLLF